MKQIDSPLSLPMDVWSFMGSDNEIKIFAYNAGLRATIDIQQLRNVAAWAVHHQAYGGIHDSKSILGGNADRRIMEAAAGDLGKSAPNPNQDCTCPACSPVSQLAIDPTK